MCCFIWTGQYRLLISASNHTRYLSSQPTPLIKTLLIGCWHYLATRCSLLIPHGRKYPQRTRSEGPDLGLQSQSSFFMWSKHEITTSLNRVYFLKCPLRSKALHINVKMKAKPLPDKQPYKSVFFGSCIKLHLGYRLIIKTIYCFWDDCKHSEGCRG